MVRDFTIICITKKLQVKISAYTSFISYVHKSYRVEKLVLHHLTFYLSELVSVYWFIGVLTRRLVSQGPGHEVILVTLHVVGSGRLYYHKLGLNLFSHAFKHLIHNTYHDYISKSFAIT